MATGPEAFRQRLKAEKEREKAVKTKTTELHQNFRAKEINEADTKLKALKEEERRKLKETEEMHRQFKKLEIGEDEKKLAELKQQERKRVQETEHMYHTHQNNTIKESDMKLSLMRQEDRRRLQEHERTMRMVNHTPGFVQVTTARELRRSSSDENLRRSSHDDNWSRSVHSSNNADDDEKETMPVPELAKQPTKPAGRFFRRSSISTDFSGNWRAGATSIKPKEVAVPAPTSAPAPAPPVAEPIETTGQSCMSSIQNARSVFSKGNSAPRPTYVRTDSSASYSSTVENIETYGNASTSSLKSPVPRAPRPLYARDDSDSSGCMAADPLDLGNSRPNLQLDTPEPSERVDEAEQPRSVETKTTTMKAAFSIFNKGGGGIGGPPLLPPKHNTYVSSKSTKPLADEIKPELVPPKENGSKAGKSLLVKALLDEIPREEEKTPEEIEGDALLSTPATVVRLDILFSFGLLTASNEPVFTNYMTAVETIVKRTVMNDATLSEYVWYDPVYPPFVQEYKTDDRYKDKSGRGNVRRLLVIASIPIFITNGISVKEAREGVCLGLQSAINSGDFIRLAKSARLQSL